MNSKELLKCLFESINLRGDLLKKVEGVIVNVFDNIELTDELVARVNDETYEFIKEYKNEKTKI